MHTKTAPGTNFSSISGIFIRFRSPSNEYPKSESSTTTSLYSAAREENDYLGRKMKRMNLSGRS